MNSERIIIVVLLILLFWFGGEWRGAVDIVAIRKDTSIPLSPTLKRGDLFQIILIQMKGGLARDPNAEEKRRLWEVAEYYRAKAVVLFQWNRGIRTDFSTLSRDLRWEPSNAQKIFG